MTDLIRRADAIEAVRKEYEDAINIGDNGDAIAYDVGRILSALPSAEAEEHRIYKDGYNTGKAHASAEAVQGCDGCRYNTRIPQKLCLRCKRYWRDSYERKGGEAK